MKCLILTFSFLSFLTMAVTAQIDDQTASLNVEWENAKTSAVSPGDSYNAPAQFPGGRLAMADYLRENVIYPELASTNAIEGIVKVRFSIMVDGTIKDPVVIQSPHESLSGAALELVEDMPLWSPRFVRGKAVASRVVIPIEFGLR